MLAAAARNFDKKGKLMVILGAWHGDRRRSLLDLVAAAVPGRAMTTPNAAAAAAATSRREQQRLPLAGFRRHAEEDNQHLPLFSPTQED